jgi:hypothetical protein
MKTELKDAMELGKLIELVEANGKRNQYSKELIDYIDMLHKKISTLEMHMEHFHDTSKKFV